MASQFSPFCRFRCSMLPTMLVPLSLNWGLVGLLWLEGEEGGKGRAVDADPGISLYTGGKILKHSSFVFMNPSRLSCLCWLKDTFLPIWPQSKSSGGSEIIILMQISPHLTMKSTICSLSY